MLYEIHSKSGDPWGYYPGGSPAEALLACHRDAGYGEDTVWLEDDELCFDSQGSLELLGTLEMWHVRPATSFLEGVRQGWTDTVTQAGSSHLTSTVLTVDEAMPSDTDPYVLGVRMAKAHLSAVAR